jgi:tellurite methyltransferase
LADWDERYREGNYPRTGPSELLVKTVRDLPHGNALDLACGAGRNSIFLAQKGWNVTGVDSSAEAIRIARQTALDSQLGAQFICADLEDDGFALSEIFDLVLKIHYLQRSLFARVREWVRPGGLFVGEIFVRSRNPNNDSMNPAYLLEPDELLSVFEGWEILFSEEAQGTLDSAQPRATARMVARRPME